MDRPPVTPVCTSVRTLLCGSLWLPECASEGAERWSLLSLVRRAPAQRPCRQLSLGHYAQTPTARPHRGSEVGGGWASRIRVGELPSHLVPYGSAMGLPWWVSQQGSLRRMQEIQVRYLGQEDPPEKEMATQPSIPAWGSHGQRSLADYSKHHYHPLSIQKEERRFAHLRAPRPV